jgi:XTP/dITP diphosphohydrolase
MLIEVVAATGNRGKYMEFVRLLKPLGISVVPMTPNLLDDIVEKGESFEENALIKARAVFEKTGCPVIADDSGLCVDALNGCPGVHSARYMGESTAYPQKIQGLLDALGGVDRHRRTARFVCAIAYFTDKETRVFSGTCEGVIGYEPKGENGFGYDPVFYVNNKSFGEMTDIEKDAVSHRAKALQALYRHLAEHHPSAAPTT